MMKIISFLKNIKQGVSIESFLMKFNIITINKTIEKNMNNRYMILKLYIYKNCSFKTFI